MKKLKNILVCFGLFAAVGCFGATISDNTLKLGKGASNKQIVFDKGSGTSNPQIRWNNSGSQLEYSNDGATFVAFPTASSASYDLLNLGLTSSVGSNLLSVAIKQSDGTTDATAGNPVKIGFRSSTLTSGAYFTRNVTGSLSISTVATGATLGTVSGQDQYIYVYAIDNAGTVELALSGSKGFDEGTRYSTTAIGASSTSLTTLYSTTARSNVAIRLIGRLKVNETTAGTYASAASELSLVPFDDKPPYAYLELTGSTSNGSTNTSVVRWTTVVTNLLGTAATFTPSATLGDSITVNETGLYAVMATFGTASGDWGITKNKTTSIISSPSNSTLLALFEPGGGTAKTITFTGPLYPGDVVRLNVQGTGTFASNNGHPAQFKFTQLHKY